MADMSAAAVATRLEQLRALWVPMGLDEARAMMEPPRVVGRELTAEVVQHRLDELRALCELTAYLGGAVPRGNSLASEP